MSRSILLVEDNDDDVFFFKTAARKAGWSLPLTICGDGREAVDLLQQYIVGETSSAGFALVLLDIKMPFMSGLEVLEWIREQPALRFLPVVMLTSSEQASDVKVAYRLGAAAFLVKPSNPEELTGLLRAIDTFWLRHNRLPVELFDLELAVPALGS